MATMGISSAPGWWLTAALLTVTWLWESPAQALETSAVRDFTLDNGLRVLMVRDAKAPVVVSHLWYRVGSADDPVGKGGLAHMLEHMMFQGTDKIPPEAFSKIIARNGGEDNAATSRDATFYFAKIASDRLERILEMEADRMRGLRIQEKEFHSENLVVREERRTRIDSDPDGAFSEAFHTLIHGPLHPYGRSAIGTMKELEGHTVEDLRAFYHTFYAPNNATLVLVGDVDPESTPELVKKHFGPIPPTTDLHRPPWPEGDTPAQPCRLEVRDGRVKVAQFHMAFPAPSLARGDQEEAVYALDVISGLLTEGRSSRLHRSLVTRQKLAISLNSSYAGTSLGPDHFYIAVTPAPKADLNKLEREILKEIDRLREEPIEAKELEKVRNTIVADHVYSMDSTSEIATTLGHLVSNGIDWRHLPTYGERILKVTPEQIQQTLKETLRQDSMCVGTLQPDAGANP